MKTWETDGRALEVCDVRDFVREPITPRDMLLAPWLESASLAMVYAARGVGKTHFAMHVAHALATGGEFLKWKAPSPVPVLYIDGEMPAADMQGRWRTVFASMGGEPDAGMLRIVSRDLQPFAEMPNLATSDGQDLFASHFNDARVIILDNLSSLAHGTKENEAEGWEPIGQWAVRQRAQGRTLLFVHHAGKSGSQRGTSKREDLLDVVIKLERPSDYSQDQGARFAVQFEKARSMFGHAAAPFEAHMVAGDDGTACWRVSASTTDDSLLRDLQAQGLTLAQIGDRVGLDKSNVSRRLRRVRAAQ